MKIVVIDDNEMNRKLLGGYIEKTDRLELVGSYDSSVKAFNDFKNNQPEVDLLFLDIEMPEMTGIEFLENLPITPFVVIVSGKEKYALNAFEYDVTDFILKPVAYPRFLKAIEKVENVKTKLNQNKLTLTESNEIFIKKNSAFVRLSYDDIIYIEALENYVVIVTYDDKYTIHFTMKSILEKMPRTNFKRVHRSFIVNVNKISMIENNNVIVNVQEERRVIPIGKSYRDQLMNEINLIIK